MLNKFKYTLYSIIICGMSFLTCLTMVWFCNEYPVALNVSNRKIPNNKKKQRYSEFRLRMEKLYNGDGRC